MSYKEIPLTNSDRKVRVSPEDYDDIIKWKWRLSSSGYAYRVIKKNKKATKIFMHKIILKIPRCFIADHIDWNKLNNQRTNLRYASATDNARNRPKQKNCACNYKGVSLDFSNKNKPYRATITISYKRIALGSYSQAEDAARAYNIAAKEIFGKFAVLNSI